MIDLDLPSGPEQVPVMAGYQLGDSEQFLADELIQASPDLMRSMLSAFVEALMNAEADSLCGAEFGKRSAERVNSHNGYRRGELATSTGTIELAIPKLRSGSYRPQWLLQPPDRAFNTLTPVVATCYLLGVSTRRLDKLVQSLRISGISPSQLSELAENLDAQLEAFRHRRLDLGPYTLVAADPLVLKVRDDGRVARMHTLVATGVNSDGHPEVLGIDLSTTDDGAGWLPFFRGLVARGLSGGPVRWSK